MKKNTTLIVSVIALLSFVAANGFCGETRALKLHEAKVIYGAALPEAAQKSFAHQAIDFGCMKGGTQRCVVSKTGQQVYVKAYGRDDKVPDTILYIDEYDLDASSQKALDQTILAAVSGPLRFRGNKDRLSWNISKNNLGEIVAIAYDSDGSFVADFFIDSNLRGSIHEYGLIPQVMADVSKNDLIVGKTGTGKKHEFLPDGASVMKGPVVYGAAPHEYMVMTTSTYYPADIFADSLDLDKVHFLASLFFGPTFSLAEKKADLSNDVKLDYDKEERIATLNMTSMLDGTKLPFQNIEISVPMDPFLKSGLNSELAAATLGIINSDGVSKDMIYNFADGRLGVMATVDGSTSYIESSRNDINVILEGSLFEVAFSRIASDADVKGTSISQEGGAIIYQTTFKDGAVQRGAFDKPLLDASISVEELENILNTFLDRGKVITSYHVVADEDGKASRMIVVIGDKKFSAGGSSIEGMIEKIVKKLERRLPLRQFKRR